MYHSWRWKIFNPTINLYSLYTFLLKLKEREAFSSQQSSQYKVDAYISCTAYIGLIDESLITEFFRQNFEVKLKFRYKQLQQTRVSEFSLYLFPSTLNQFWRESVSSHPEFIYNKSFKLHNLQFAFTLQKLFLEKCYQESLTTPKFTTSICIWRPLVLNYVEFDLTSSEQQIASQTLKTVGFGQGKRITRHYRGPENSNVPFPKWYLLWRVSWRFKTKQPSETLKTNLFTNMVGNFHPNCCKFKTGKH